MNDAYFAGFIRRNFKKTIRKSCDPAGDLFTRTFSRFQGCCKRIAKEKN